MLFLFVFLLLFANSFAVFATEGTMTSADKAESDKLLQGTQVTADGTVAGDLLLLGQNVSMHGRVGGDLLGLATELSVSGTTEGNLRSISLNLTDSGTVKKNMTVFAGNANLTKESRVEGNLYLIGDGVILEGTVLGKTWVAASTVTLSGTFEGDVTVESVAHSKEKVSGLRVLPGTNIKGTLTYKGNLEPEIPEGASVGKLVFAKTELSAHKNMLEAMGWKIAVRKLLGGLLLFLLGLLLFNLFPRFFHRPAAYIGENFLATAGVGVAALGVSVGAGILLFLVAILSALFFPPVVLLILMSVPFSFMLLISFFSLLPVALWLGRMLTRSENIALALAAGLGTLTGLEIVLFLLSKVPVIGSVFTVLLGILGFAIWLVGTGAILKSLKLYHQAAANGAEEPLVFDR